MDPKVAPSVKPSNDEFQPLISLFNQGRIPETLAEALALSSKYPDDPSLNNMIGVIYARLGESESALEHYEKALSSQPDFAEAQNNRGNTLVRLGRYEAAIASFRQALQSKPDYVVAHNNLGNAYHKAGHWDEAIQSYKNALGLKPDYAEAHNNLGNVLVDADRHPDALECFTRAVQHDPRLAEAYHNMGDTLRAVGRYEDAARNFATAVRIRPDYALAYLGWGNALNDQGLHHDAVKQLRISTKLDPHSAAAHNDLGNALSDSGKHEEAMACYLEALSLDPSFAELHSNLGNAYYEKGDYEGAKASYEKAVSLKPRFSEAHNNLSLVKKYVSGDPQIAQMQEILKDTSVAEKDQMYLSFALGKSFEDIGDIDKSFGHFQEGNRLRKKELAYSIESDRADFALIKSLFGSVPSVTVDESDGQSEVRKNPIFIVGMPRSGTTLTEQILASHSQVHGAGELQAVGRILSPVLRKQGASERNEIRLEVLSNLREHYLGELDKLDVDESWVTDKMPTNFKWIGFLLTAMPTAKIVNLQRNPVACCWSMFKLLISRNKFTNDLEDLAEYYLLYEDLMSFWREKFPNRIYDLDYEALTESQEIETRKLLEYCSLPWDEQCLDFHKTKRAVRTPSGTQVRKQMYTGSSEAWRKYQTHLGPLLLGLGSKTGSGSGVLPVKP